MEKRIFFLIPDIQHFADGGAGAGATGAGDAGANGGTGSSTGSQQGVTARAAAVQVDNVSMDERSARYQELIRGEYKDLFDADVQGIVKNRLKSSKETVDRYTALQPTLDTLARKYGVDVNDIEALNAAIEEDDTYYEDEALEKGISVQQLKEIRKMERENSELKRQMQEASIRENADRIYAQWMQQSEAVKNIYPSFDLAAELQNAKFSDLLRNNIDVRTAYEVIHKDEIIPSAMQFAAQQTEAKITNKIRANGMRPMENGMAAQGANLTHIDVANLTKEQRAEYIRRAARGERITFR